MPAYRAPVEIQPSLSTLEGAGVRLKRGFGFSEAPRFDPFLLLDEFKSKNPEDYLAGFPWHPHRGIETVTYVIEGRVEHGDSIGNSGEIGPGDVQWMTAGGGIVHQEMPKGGPDGMWGMQLWVNLPARDKMMEPRYRDVAASTIPAVDTGSGALVRVIAGEFNGVEGPARGLVRQPRYLDVELEEKGALELALPASHNGFAYVIEGSVTTGGQQVDMGHVARFGEGDAILLEAAGGAARFILAHGEPLGEPVAWRGPIVMNTQEELDLAFRQYREGTFLNRKG